MNVREHRAVATHESRVAGHAHVKFQIVNHSALRIFNMKAKQLKLLRLQWTRVAIPDHSETVRKRWPRRPRRIVARKRLAMHIRADIEIHGQRFRKAIGVDHVGIQLVKAARQVRQLLAEASGAFHFRMQVPHAVHFRPLDHIKMHQMIVVRHEIVQLARNNPAGIAEFENQFTAIK